MRLACDPGLLECCVINLFFVSAWSFSNNATVKWNPDNILNLN